MFVIHEPDKARLWAYLLNGAKRRRKFTKAEVDKLNESYWRAHCRHSIPEPEKLVAAVEAVMEKFAGGVCAKNQDPLITEEVQKVHNLQVELMKQGLLSGEFESDRVRVRVFVRVTVPVHVYVPSEPAPAPAPVPLPLHMPLPAPACVLLRLPSDHYLPVCDFLTTAKKDTMTLLYSTSDCAFCIDFEWCT